MAGVLLPGSIAAVKRSGGVEAAVALQLLNPQDVAGKIKCTFFDNQENVSGVITSQVAAQFAGKLTANSIVKITEGSINNVNENDVLIVAALELIEEGSIQPAPEAPPVVPAAAVAAVAPEQQQQQAPATTAKTPAASLKPTTTTTKTPASGPSPPSAGWAKNAGRPVQPIASLNPYNPSWAIRAKIVSRNPKRSFNKNGTSSSVFSAEIIDESGTAIEATFWGAAADRYYDLLPENTVAFFSKGSIKPANKKYSSVPNDYCINFDTNAEISPCESEIDTSKMVKPLAPVSIGQLVAFVDKRMPVDLLGVVTAVGPLASVKRKSDSSEIARRDITMVDRDLKTVTVTMWSPAAENVGGQLETAFNSSSGAAEAPVMLAISSCRISSYNGVSASTLARSVITINPTEEDAPGCSALTAWWQEEGATASTTHVGDGMATALKPNAAGGGGTNSRDRVTNLQSVRDTAPAMSTDKPVWSNIMATVAVMNPEQSLYYAAAPGNNRKVVEQDGEWYCEFDGQKYSTMTRRYIAQARVMDTTGELPVQVFNDQAEMLLGMTADELAAVRETNDVQYRDIMKRVMWSEWMVKVKAQTQEYQGEQRQRYAVVELKPVDYAVESRRLLEAIKNKEC